LPTLVEKRITAISSDLHAMPQSTLERGAAMTRIGEFLVAVLTATRISQATAVEGPALAKANQCTVCHATDNRVVGPSFKEVAAKYKDDAKAADELAASIKGGSTGKWGAVPMPPNGAVSDADTHALAAWILSL
jgi:cytochrome c